MHKHTEAAIAVVATDLHAAEKATDTSLRAMSQLLASVMDGSAAVALRFGASQGAITDIAEATKLMTTARHHLCRAHEQIRRVGTKEGLVTLYGDTDPTFKSARDILPETAPA